jgi:RNA polymerase sigma-70 factor (ECF subfamily)
MATPLPSGAFDDLLAAARVGDEVAFAKLWRWLHPALVRWLSVVVPGHAEDVASETWLSVSRGLTSFEGGEGDFRGWVFTIGRRRAIDWARHRQRQPRITTFDATELVDPSAVSSSLVDASNALQSALTLLRRLTPDQAEVVALRVIVGLTVAETAAVVDKAEGAVRVLCHRGLRELAQQLDTQQLAEGVTA